MGKIKKYLGVFCFLIMAVLFMPVTIYAAENEEERVIVYAQIPEDWENPCIWAWDEEGNNVFEAWPGEEMNVDAGNDGWYYDYIPKWATHVIVNANAGEIQTGELILEGKDTWLSISDADTVEISYDKVTEGELPEYVEQFVIHASVDESWDEPCLWAWMAPEGTSAFEAWPGTEMQEENGWYTAKVPIWVNSIIINANAGEVQTEDISIDPAEVWVTVAADGSYDFSYNDPEKEVVPNVTVHVMAPADWDSPCLWAWSAPDGTNVYSTWPGEVFEEVDGWLTKEIPGWVNSIIVSANEGAVQTTDISVEVGKDTWIVVNGTEEYEVFYEEPNVAASAGNSEVTESADSNAIWIIVAIVVAIGMIVLIVAIKKKTTRK